MTLTLATTRALTEPSNELGAMIVRVREWNEHLSPWQMPEALDELDVVEAADLRFRFRLEQKQALVDDFGHPDRRVAGRRLLAPPSPQRPPGG